MDETDLNSNIRKIKEGIGVPYLHINRLPINVYRRFKSFASNEEFARDYGMAIKFLLDFYEGLIPTGMETLQLEIEELKSRVENLETNKEEKNPTKKRLDGTGGKDGNT